MRIQFYRSKQTVCCTGLTAFETTENQLCTWSPEMIRFFTICNALKIVASNCYGRTAFSKIFIWQESSTNIEYSKTADIWTSSNSNFWHIPVWHFYYDKNCSTRKHSCYVCNFCDDFAEWVLIIQIFFSFSLYLHHEKFLSYMNNLLW